VSIIGLGVDIAEIDFWRRAQNDPTTSVLEGTFTEQELKDAANKTIESAQRLATRFAAKEAFIKALSGGRYGQSPLSPSLSLKEIEVVQDQWNRPKLKLHGKALSLFESRGAKTCHLSLSHEPQYAVAAVILEA